MNRKSYWTIDPSEKIAIFHDLFGSQTRYNKDTLDLALENIRREKPSYTPEAWNLKISQLQDGRSMLLAAYNL